MDTATARIKTREEANTLPAYHQLPLVPVSGRGCEIELVDGRRLLDFYGGHAVASLGYAHPELTRAISTQAAQLVFQSNALPLDLRAAAAEKLLKVAPASLSGAFFVNSGAEANENALRLACTFTKRRKVLALTHGFHGRTAAAAAVTWGARERWYGFPELPFEVDFIPRDDADAARAMIDDTVAAVIVEAVQGIAGAHDLSPEFLRSVREQTQAVDALLIADEVQCGMGRTGQAFAIQHYDVEPDLLTAAKGLGGGMPCGALLATEAIAATVGVGDLGSTFGGGPLAAAAINAVLDSLEREDLLRNVREREREIRETCLTGPVRSIQGRGLLLGLRVDGTAAATQAALLDQGVLTGLSADPGILRLLPPLVLTSADVRTLASALRAVS